MHHMGTNATVTEADLDYAAIQQAKGVSLGRPGDYAKARRRGHGRHPAEGEGDGGETSMDTCYDGKGEWLPLIEPALPHLDIVFSSLEEARCYTGKHSPEEIADFYASYGVQTVVVKLGVDGLYLKRGDETFYLAAHAVEVVDTTGAGRRVRGFLYGHVRGWDLRQRGRLANAVGGLTVQRMGGAEALVSLDETLKFMETAATYASAAAV